MFSVEVKETATEPVEEGAAILPKYSRFRLR
jgi:hypothetical protein